ncbi:hypothetical protein ACHQM5_025164 [Ranunculus cassubicifolius]
MAEREMENLQSSGENEMVMEKSSPSVETTKNSTYVNPADVKVRIGDYGVYRFETEGDRAAYDEAYLRVVMADESKAKKRREIVLELYKSAPDTYRFLLDDYMNRALHPLRKILENFLERFDRWPYWLVRFLYVAMRDAKRSLLVPVPEFKEIFELAESIFFKWEMGCDPDPAEIHTKISELRKRIKPWVHTMEGQYTLPQM